MAPFFGLSTRSLSGPVLRDTARLSQRYPHIARYGVFGVSTSPIGCDTPPLSDRFPLGEHAKWRCDTPPPPQQKGHLSDICAIPHENKENGCGTPLLRYYLEKGVVRYGGASRTGLLSQIHESLRELLREIFWRGLGHEMCVRELLRECPRIPRVAPSMAFWHSKSVSLIELVPRLLRI